MKASIRSSFVVAGWAGSMAALFVIGALPRLRAAEPATTKAAAPAATSAAKLPPAKFDTPEQAADAIVDAAGKFDVPQLLKIVGTDGEDIILTGEFAQDRQRAQDFAGRAKEKKNVSVDPTNASHAVFTVGAKDWPFPLPLVKQGGKWSFDVAAGRQEILNRRIGSNELDAIEICHGFVEAQYAYAYRKREGYSVNQYAQRIISTAGKQDGLAWQNKDGTWGGPVGERVAQAIEQGYAVSGEPYHGYFFKVLKGQGPAAPHGQIDYVVKGIMIGGFALVAAPAEYRETGIKTFMVSQDGVVYEKDLGAATLQEFQSMERFNPDKSWTPVNQ
jgi:hypothetical protein